MENLGRTKIETLYGPLGKGLQEVMIGDALYDIDTLRARLGLDFDDARAFDIVPLADQHFVFRYYDGQDQRVVAHEFNLEFQFIGEIRAHVAEWIGEEAYYNSFRGVEFRCPLVPGDDF